MLDQIIEDIKESIEVGKIKRKIRVYQDEDGEISLKYDGKRQKQLGMGGYRVAFQLEGLPLVAKVEYDDTDDQAKTEYKTYKTLSKSKYKEYIAKTYKPFKKKVNGTVVNVTLQERAEGKTISSTKNKKALTLWNSVREGLLVDFGVRDQHDSNAAWHGKTKVMKFFDLGRCY